MNKHSLSLLLQFSIIVVSLTFYMNQLDAISSSVKILESQNESHPTHYPHLIGNIRVGRTHEVFVESNYAYVTTDQALVVINISNPYIPEKVSEITMEGALPVAIVKDELAYIINMKSHKFLIANVSNPESPNIIGNYTPDVDWEHFTDLMVKLEIVENYLYVLSNALGLMIFNVADPTNPILIGEYDTGDYNAGMAIREDVLFYTNAEIGIKALNISDRSNPYQIASLNMERGVFDLDIHEDILYVSNYFYGVVILNISDPLNPRIISSLGETIDANDPPRSRALSGNNNYLAIAKMERGISFVDVSDPTTPSELALYSDSRPTNCLFDGQYVYITDFDTSKSFEIVEFIPEDPSTETSINWNSEIFILSILFVIIIGLSSIFIFWSKVLSKPTN